MLEAFTWYKQSAFRWKGEKLVVYIDPWGLVGDLPPADLILITHAHGDHYEKSDIAKVKASKTAFVAPADVAKELSGKASELSGKAVSLAQDQRKAVLDAYGDLASRGEKLVSSVRRSAYTKRAVAQSKTARTQVKAAATSIRKAAGSTATATKAAAKKVG